MVTIEEASSWMAQPAPRTTWNPTSPLGSGGLGLNTRLFELRRDLSLPPTPFPGVGPLVSRALIGLDYDFFPTSSWHCFPTPVLEPFLWPLDVAKMIFEPQDGPKLAPSWRLFGTFLAIKLAPHLGSILRLIFGSSWTPSKGQNH